MMVAETWVAGRVGLVAALGGLAGASLGLLVRGAQLGLDGQAALAMAGHSAVLGGGWLALALWRRADPRWLVGGALGGACAALALATYLLALFRWGGLGSNPTWFVGAVVGPPLLAWALGLALAARFGRLSRAGTLVSALGLGPAMASSWLFLLFLALPAVLLPALLVAPLLLTGRGTPPPDSPRAVGWLQLGYLALPLALAVGFAVVTLARL